MSSTDCAKLPDSRVTQPKGRGVGQIVDAGLEAELALLSDGEAPLDRCRTPNQSRFRPSRRRGSRRSGRHPTLRGPFIGLEEKTTGRDERIPDQEIALNANLPKTAEIRRFLFVTCL
ncbi:MAG: hypothetical protein K2Y17_09335 [Qipengyuania sp.]|nr:hypothetical protein [Qipengyuania sp.]